MNHKAPPRSVANAFFVAADEGYNSLMSQAAVSAIELRPNRSGQLRAYLAGTRVRVQDIYALSELQGKTPDEIVAALPHLNLFQVHSALAYYFQHRMRFCMRFARTMILWRPCGRRWGRGLSPEN
jgi:uncharacterized protein (DUF433 family)